MLSCTHPNATVGNIEELLRNDTKIKVAGIDVDGQLRGKLISKKKFLGAVKHGFGFCSIIFGWDMDDRTYSTDLKISNKDNDYPDILAIPDLSTFRRIPWEDNVPFFLVYFHHPKTMRPIRGCPRGLLKSQAAKLEEHNLSVMVGTDIEFYHFRGAPGTSLPHCELNCERNNSTTAQFLSNNRADALPHLTEGMFGYSLVKPLQNKDYYYDVFNTCEKFDTDIEGWHTETGPGVFEAAIAYGEIKNTADRANLFKLVARAMAIEHGITPSFMAKPMQEYPGCSGHVHISITDKEGQNLFARTECDPEPQFPELAHFSDMAIHFLAGILEGLPDIMPLCAPTINSYKRYIDKTLAPISVSWGFEHRSAAVRLIAPPVSKASATRFEFRVPGADANAHYVYAAVIALGWRGVQKKLELKLPPLGNGRIAGSAEDHGMMLSKTLKEANERFMSKGSIAREILGDEFVDYFGGTREHEVKLWDEAVTGWEVRRYLETV